jgi:hypothetical protein
MRWICLGVIILFAAATIIFALQNFEIITMSVFGFDARVPLAVLVAVAYLLGAATGAACSRCCADPTRVQDAGWSASHNYVVGSLPTIPGWGVGRRM